MTNTWHLILSEIYHRKFHFGFMVFGVMTAVACSTSVIMLLTIHNVQTEQILRSKRQVVQNHTEELEDQMRKISKGMGFNIVILPEDQNLNELYSNNYASKFMPESYASKLAESKIVTINHLLPTVEQRIRWPERNNRTVFLVGIRGQVPITHRQPQKPIAQTVPLGQIVLGSEIAMVENLKVGDKVTLRGEKFTVSQIHNTRGNKDDITIWIHLLTAQRMLKKEGFINAIWAIECGCALTDLPKITREILAYLPDTQVIEKFTKAQARANMRMEAAKLAKKILKQEKIHRQHLENERRTLASSVISASVVAGGIWIAFLSLINVRDRRSEIGILRAIGIGSSQIIKLFLFKSIIVGFLGAMLGYLIGLLIVIELNAYAVKPSSLLPTQIFSWRLMLLIVVCVPVMAAVAGWLPAFIAAGKDPAVALREA